MTHTTNRGVQADTHKKTDIRLPKQLYADVVAAAEARCVSFNWLLTRLLEDGMKRLAPDVKVTRD